MNFNLWPQENFKMWEIFFYFEKKARDLQLKQVQPMLFTVVLYLEDIPCKCSISWTSMTLT